SSSGFRLEGTDEGGKTLYENWITPDYFATVGIRLEAGRPFGERDNEQSASVAIINESVARHYFQAVSPVGQRLGFSKLDTEIVGVVSDARTQTLHDDPVPMVYFPIGQKAAVLSQTALTNLDVRFQGENSRGVSVVRDAIAKSEPLLLVSNIGS